MVFVFEGSDVINDAIVQGQLGGLKSSKFCQSSLWIPPFRNCHCQNLTQGRFLMRVRAIFYVKVFLRSGHPKQCVMATRSLSIVVDQIEFVVEKKAHSRRINSIVCSDEEIHDNIDGSFHDKSTFNGRSSSSARSLFSCLLETSKYDILY